MMRLLVLSFLLLVFVAPVRAATLFGVVSERSAAELAAGAERFAERHPGHRLILRTREQIAELSDVELKQLWRQADAILLGAVFGDAVPRLVRLMADAPPPAGVPVFATNSDRRILRLSRLDGRPVFAGLDKTEVDRLLAKPGPGVDPAAHRAGLAEQFPDQAAWLRGHAYWVGRGSHNLAGLIAWLLHRVAPGLDPPPPQPHAAIRYFHQGAVVAADQLALDAARPVVALLDYDYGDRAGDRALLNHICTALQDRELQCVAVLARWGEASVQALESLADTLAPARLAAVVSLQDFVIGGGEGRARATQALERLNVPVIKGVRLTDRTAGQWRLSADGLPWDSVHYRIAMPELQGLSQPLVLALAEPPRTHALTGLELTLTRPADTRIDTLAARVRNWVRLQTLDNADKRIAIIYYNHPPGRHNIGADNLDVPASLWELLHELKAAGYDTGPLPASPEALLEQLQARGVNLPENRAALGKMSRYVAGMPVEDYQRWFETLPAAVRQEMIQGPLGYLHAQLETALAQDAPTLGRDVLQRVMGDLTHVVEGADHPARERALDLLDQLQTNYRAALNGQSDWDQARRLNEALVATGIEGLKGWGPPPGRSMVHDGRLVFPGLRFGKVFIGPQPPRGWELNEELLHANTAIAPPHQYLAFYHWLHADFQADALVHLGRHSTYEFLPRRRVGLAEDDYPGLIAGDIPGVYPYIVDGVGEGIQAKRRGLAVIVDHLTPPLQTTPLYDDLLELRQLVESFEAADGREDSPLRARAVSAIRETIDRLDLRQELEANMSAELQRRGIGFEQVDDALLVHEVGHYLTELQEDFMPHGLHVFGRDWAAEDIDMMLDSMAADAATPAELRPRLAGSPAREMAALLAGLDGEFVAPGKGNDPIRTPEALPTGRNFHALDGGLLPTRVGYALGVRLAREARADNASSPDGSEAVVLWASDTVRDEGAMVAFGLDMLGIRPVWNSRGILRGLERLPLTDGRRRRDVVFTTSGLFRDLYANLLVWLDRAVLLALDGASETIRSRHPKLIPALEAALAPLAEYRDPGADPLTQNRVAAHWVAETREQLRAGVTSAEAGRQATLRIFGDAPGAYGAGVNRLVERSGAWQSRDQLAEAYLHRMGHAYGVDKQGAPVHDHYRTRLARVENTYLGRASNLYGLLDNNDAFDYLGGLSLAVESLTGEAPNNNVIHHADPDNPGMQPLATALLGELRGRYLNPAWLKPLMTHGYAGARTMGSEFMEYLWGWQTTNPDIIRDWVWEEVKGVYMDDKLDLGLDEFLEQGRNVHVKTNMEAIMLVAIHKQFWDADPQTVKQLARAFARHVVDHGLPGSGHTRPDHPMLEWVRPQLEPELREAFTRVLAAARMEPVETASSPTRIAEVEIEETEKHSEPQPASRQDQAEPAQNQPRLIYALGAALALLLLGGILSGYRAGVRQR
ncbi:MAG TPA: cobaltochelatase subunit CobN [Thiohalobacter sp.]|nr:cobaltochelatase subunit CobN [Thiohalobacter sp.]